MFTKDSKIYVAGHLGLVGSAIMRQLKAQGYTNLITRTHGELELTDQAKEFLIEKGYNPDFGARPLRRSIEHYIEDPLSEAMLRGEFKGKNLIRIDVQDEEHMKLEGFHEDVPSEEAEPVAHASEKEE